MSESENIFFSLRSETFTLGLEEEADACFEEERRSRSKVDFGNGSGVVLQARFGIELCFFPLAIQDVLAGEASVS